MSKYKLLQFCFDAAKDVDVFHEYEAAGIALWIIDRVIDTLREDSRVPKRSYDEWSLAFADLQREIEDGLGDLDGKADRDAVVEAIAEALTINPRVTKSRQRAINVGTTP